MQSVKNGISYDLNGWKYISIKGTPRERGYAHGYLAAKEMKEIQAMLRFNVFHDTGVHWEYYIDICKHDFTQKIIDMFPEIYEEMQGLTEGCNAAGTDITLDEMIAWNNSMEALTIAVHSLQMVNILLMAK